MSRPNARARGYTSKWDRERKHYLHSNPLCVICHTKGIITQADVVDHITPHKGDLALFWDRSNWQALCYSCHNRTKQGIEQRGYDKSIGLDGWPTDPHHPANKRHRGGGKKF